MTIREIEDLLSEKGYSIGDRLSNKEDAKKKAAEFRSDGYMARVVEYTTSIRGYHYFVIWYKAK